MKNHIGLWIDHRKAVIVFDSENGEKTQEIDSNMEKHVRFVNSSGEDGSGAEDMRDRQFDNHLDAYYDEIIALVTDTDSILILGPGEAKGELEARLNRSQQKGRIIQLETADKMTTPQIAAMVRQHFLAHA